MLNIDTNKCTSEFTTEVGYSRINDIASCPSNGNYCILSCSTETKGSLIGLNLKLNKAEHKFPVASNAIVNTLSFNHNGTMFIAGCNDGYVRVYDVNTQSMLMNWKAHDGEVTSAHFNSTETTIMTAGGDNRVKQWSTIQGGKVMQTLQLVPYEEEYTRKLALSEDRGECFVLSGPAMVFSLPLRKATCLLQWGENSGGSGRLSAVDWYGTNMVAGAAQNVLYMFTAET